MSNSKLPPQAAIIKHAVASATTCSSATLDQLTLLLGEPRPLVHLKKDDVKASHKSRTAVASAKVVPSRTRKKPAIATVIEIHEDVKTSLEPLEKFRLATEIVNSSLKGLTEAIKAPITQKTPHSRKAQNQSCSTDVAQLSTPLQPQSVNQMSKTTDQPLHSRRSSSALSNGRNSGVVALAECGRLAFATLRKLDSQKSSGVKMVQYQLETGMLALISKMVTIGLDDLAIRELRILWKRLSGGEGFSDATKPSKISKDGVSNPVKQSLADLLYFAQIPRDFGYLSLVVALQLQVLKIMALRRGYLASIEASLEHLQSSAPHAPQNLIQKLASESCPESEGKAARQLEILSQSLLALCPSISSADDNAAADTRSNMSPHIALNFQLLSLKTRTVWWELSGHRADTRAELVEPFAKYLRAFSRRSKLSDQDKFETAKNAYISFSKLTGVKIVNPSPIALSHSLRTSKYAEIYQDLADLALRTSQLDEAVQWYRQSVTSARECGASQCRIGSMLCQLSMVLMHGRLDSGQSVDCSRVLGDVIKILEDDLEGDSAELDEFLMSVARLRKVAFLMVADTSTTKEYDNSTTLPPHILSSIEFLSLIPTLLMRYIGSGPNPGSSDKLSARYQQRQRLAERMIKPTVETIANFSKLHVTHDTNTWRKIDKALQKCARLVTFIEVHSQDQSTLPGEEVAAASLALMLSNAYWCHYLKEKQTSRRSKDLHMVLQKSIDLIRECKEPEKITGFLPVKLEHLGIFYEQSKNLTESLHAYTEALRVLIDTGSLDIITEDAATRPLSFALSKDGLSGSLGRILSAYCKLAYRIDGKETPISLFFDDERLSIIKRGVILEHQLTVLEKTLQTQNSSVILSPTLQEIASRLLDVYTETENPIRRLRTVVQLLRIHFAYPLVLRADICSHLLCEQGKAFPESFDTDSGLQMIVANLIASRDAYCALLQGVCASLTLQPVMKTWHDLVQASPNSKSLQEKIGSLSDWLNLLQSVAEYLGMQGYEVQRTMVLDIMIAVKELTSTYPEEGLVVDLSALGQQLVRLGFSMKAGISLQKAKRYVENTNVSTSETLFWHLASAEYFLEIGNATKCEEHVASARGIAALRSSSEHSRPKNSSEQIRSTSAMSSVAYVRSRLAVVQGQPALALFHGRMCVKFAYRNWALLEYRARLMARSSVVNATVDELDQMSNDLNSLSISIPRPPPVLSTEHQSLKNAPFWSLVPQLFDGLLHLARLYANEGLLPEAHYYTLQAQSIADSVNSTTFQAQCRALLGEYKIYCGRLEEGLVQLRSADDMISKQRQTPFGTCLQALIAEAYGSRSQWDLEESNFRLAQDSLLGIVSPIFLSLEARKPTLAVDLSFQLSDLSLKEPALKPKVTAKKGTALTRRTKNKTSNLIQPEPNLSSPPSADDLLLQKLRARLLRQQARRAILRKKAEQASSCLMKAATLPGTQLDSLMQSLRQAQLYLCQGLGLTFSDPVFCVLHESTLSYPSIVFDRRRQSKEKMEPLKDVKQRVGQTRKQPSKSLAKDTMLKDFANANDFNECLRKALEVVRNFHSTAQVTAPTSVIHTISDVSGKISMMLSANGFSSPNSVINSVFVVYLTELGRSISILKESSAILVEKTICTHQDLGHPPAIGSLEDLEGLSQDSTIDLGSFKANYIDIIPSSWVVISISISEDRNELHFSKLRQGQTPFILNIPLNRHNLRDTDEEIFGFDQGKSELLNIIELANYSTHDTPDMSVKGAKTAWWEARSALDARLRDLLVNIENIWLGGFRGILAQDIPRNDLLSRFQRSFYNILERHLPSRQKCSKSAKISRPALDFRVLELFIRLGNPNEAGDMDEALMDLLYFVIDILQFHGERNAYDEIDFDSIAIETLDALRHYHEAALHLSQDRSPNHTILVLDKELHCFPWESLPCMTGQAVSRLPSLVCLRNRILQVQQQNTAHPYASEGYLVNRRKSSYVLNPSADLQSTQSAFLPSLSDLPIDSVVTPNIVGRSPTESEFQSILSTNSLFLYFGHGSGGQYIRFRTVKKLDQCAVSLLMGCSSAKLKEEGGYEPHGMIKNYLAAGAPAVVGMLWDVTDKDCDRWGMECLDSWGLFEKQSTSDDATRRKEPPKGNKGKGRKQDEIEFNDEVGQGLQKARGTISLDQAVAMGREKCFLRYLNGAAPVMYGIPAFLS